jgi:hypothetical protein
VSDPGATVASLTSDGEAERLASGAALSVDRAMGATVLDGEGMDPPASALVAERLHENESQSAMNASERLPAEITARFDITRFANPRMGAKR